MASVRICGILFLAFVAGVFGVQFTHPDGISYEGNYLYKVHVKTAEQALRLKDIQRSFNRISSDAEFNPLVRIDVWPDHEIGLGDIMIRVPSAINNSFRSKLDKKGFTFDIVSENLQELINKEAEYNQQQDSDDFFSTYRTYEEFESFLKSLEINYPSIASTFHVGNSFEGRNITGIRIAGPANVTRPGFFFNGGQHAREWIGPATVAYIANKLVTGYGSDSSITSLVDGVEFFIVPLVNPDGYVYTKQDRMWRKNRSKGKTVCYGTDNNRNWGYEWNTGGSSAISCEETYHGPYAFSEKENTAVAEYIAAHTNIEAYIDFHSYSQVFMNPWGYTRQLTPDNAIQQQVAKAAVAKMEAVYGYTYEVGTTANLLYIASGGSHDWAYGAAGIVYSFGVELRDTGEYGFLLPADQIVPQGEEAYPGVEYIAQYLLTL